MGRSLPSSRRPSSMSYSSRTMRTGARSRCAASTSSGATSCGSCSPTSCPHSACRRSTPKRTRRLTKPGVGVAGLERRCASLGVAAGGWGKKQANPVLGPSELRWRPPPPPSRTPCSSSLRRRGSAGRKRSTPTEFVFPNQTPTQTVSLIPTPRLYTKDRTSL